MDERMENQEPELCARCQGALCDESGYCAPCSFEVEVELDAGFGKLQSYLENWAGFSDWCQANGTAAGTL